MIQHAFCAQWGDIMADFRIVMKSIGGLIVGDMPRCDKVSAAPGGTTPEYSSTDFVRYGNGIDESIAASEFQWNENWAPSMVRAPGTIEASELIDTLIAEGAISRETAIDIMEIQLQDNYGNPVLSPSLVMKMHTSSNRNSPEWWLAKKEIVEGQPVYTLLTDYMTLLIVDSSFYKTFQYGFCAGVFTVGGVPTYGLGCAARLRYFNMDAGKVYGDFYLATEEAFIHELTYTPGGEPFSPEFGPGSEPGGYGPGGGGTGGPGPTFDGVSDPWTPTPTKPGVLSYGLLNLYKCDTGSLINLGRDLFPEITWPPTTGFSDLIEWLGMTIQAVSDSIWNKGLIDYIVSVHLIPIDVTGGALTDIKIGPRTMTGILARPITADVIEFDCGTVHIDEYYTNYVDYMTKCRVYLPFYGWVDIKPEYWQSADISIKYLWNVVDGSFIAQIFSTIERHQSPCTVMIGQYSGNACVHLPLSGANYANMFSQLAGAAGGMAAGVASGNVSVAATSAMNLAGNNGQMQQSNAYNASSAFYGHSRPYLMIERPVSHFSTNYVTEKGLPLIKTKRIGSCSGFTIAEDIILDGIPCTEAEKEKIRQMFKSGVIIR